MKAACLVVAMGFPVFFVGAEAHAAPVEVAAGAPLQRGEVQLAKKKPEEARSRGGGDSKPLKGDLGWVVSGAVGAMVPLLLFALPFVWFAWIPGVGPFVLVVVAVWAGLMGLLGGTVAWLMMTFLSPERSGFLLPILVSGALTAGVALVAGVLAACILLAGWFGASFFGGWFIPGPTPPWYGVGYEPVGYGLWWGASLLGFTVWTIGAVAASLAGPLVGAYLYHRLSIPSDGKTHVDVLTPN